jgi:biopolymer transport protein ExbB/biopolymer transport protein TolQ
MNSNLTKKLLQMAAVGSEWVLYGLIALSVLSIAIVVQRSIWFWRHRCNMKELVPKLLGKLEAGGFDEALTLLKAHPATEASITARCLEWRDKGKDAMSNVLEATVRERRPDLERGTLFLGTVGNNAPFIGLFGTVLGVVQAFMKLGQNAGGSMDAVMSSIGEALIATAVGILVAIPAVIAFNVLSRKATQVEENAELMVNLLLATGPKRQPEPAE